MFHISSSEFGAGLSLSPDDLGDKYSIKSEELNENLKYIIIAVYDVSDLLDKPIEQVYILSDDISKKKRKYKEREFYQPKQRFFD